MKNDHAFFALGVRIGTEWKYEEKILFTFYKEKTTLYVKFHELEGGSDHCSEE